MLPPCSSRRLSRPLLVVLLLAGTSACKPAGSSTTASRPPPPPEVALPSPADARRPPGTEELARFLRGKLPAAALRLAEFKHDPPVPLPGAPAGSPAWLYQVRVTLAPAEDVLGPPAPATEEAFRADQEALRTLATWSVAYARSPYAARYPGFPVEAPPSPPPALAVLVRAKDQPLDPLYGKLSAEWQVDHWNYALVSLQSPPDVPGSLRSDCPSPLLVQGTSEAEQYQALLRAHLAAAREKKATLDAAYGADLLKATQPGTTYRGQITHGKNRLAAEVRFLAPAAGGGGDPHVVPWELRLPENGYLYRGYARLATSPPVRLEPGEADSDETLSLAADKSGQTSDLAAGYEHVTDPKNDHLGTPSFDFRTATMGYGDAYLPWSVHAGRLEGRMTLYHFAPAYLFSAQQSP